MRTFSISRSAVVLLALASAACGSSMKPATRTTPAGDVSSHAARLYREAIVIDGHNDMPSKMLDDGYDADVRHQPGFEKDEGQTDFPRLVESGITGQFFSAFVDASFTRPTDQSWERVQAYLDTIHAFASRHPDKLLFATTAADVERAKREGKVAVLIGVEGGHSIENSLDHLRELHRRGARYMTLTWNNGNDWAGSSVGVFRTRRGGLTDFGRQVVREMNRLGMLVDLSHVSDSTFFDAIATSTRPVIASHSSARALSSHPRNLSDDQLRAIAKNGGVVCVNFYATFLDPRFAAAKDSVERKVDLETRGLLAKPGVDSEAVIGDAERLKETLVRQLPPPPLSILIDHIEHIARVAGVDHVGLGSDFDGVSGLLPQGMDDVTRMPRIVQALIDRGWSDADIRKLLGGNVLRVMRASIDNVTASR